MIMALLRCSTEIVRRALINLYFDDETEKHFEIGEKDIIRVRYNDAGYAKEITGRVDEIRGELPPHQHHPMNHACGGTIPVRQAIGSDGFMVVDGSDVYSGKRSRIFFKDILDMDIIEKYDEQFIVRTTSDGPATKIRVIDGTLQVYVAGNFVNIDDLLSTKTKELLVKVEESLSNENNGTTPETGNGNETVPEDTTNTGADDTTTV